MGLLGRLFAGSAPFSRGDIVTHEKYTWLGDMKVRKCEYTREMGWVVMVECIGPEFPFDRDSCIEAKFLRRQGS